MPTTGVPLLVDWGLASTDAVLARYELERRIGDGAWQPLALTSATASAVAKSVPAGVTVKFRVRAVDGNGTVGKWVSSTSFRANAVSDSSTTIHWSSGWAAASYSSYLGRRVHSTATRGASATMTFQGSAFAWAGPVGPTRGKARIYVDGQYLATVDLHRSHFAARDLVIARNIGDGTHTIKIVTLGTTGRPTVAIDALYVLDPS